MSEATMLRSDRIEKLLSSIADLVTIEPETSDFYNQVLQVAGEVANSTSCSLFLRDHKNGCLNEVATCGEKVELIGFVNFELGDGFSAWVGREKRPIKLGNIMRKSRGKFASLLAVPLLVGDELIGVINLGHTEKDAFTKTDMRLIQLVAAQVAMALQRVSLRRQGEWCQQRMDHLIDKVNILEQELFVCRKSYDQQMRANSLIDQAIEPLTRINGCVDFLLSDYHSTDTRLLERLHLISEAAARISTVISRHKEIAKLATDSSAKTN